MDSPYSPLEYALLNDWQRDFPIVAHPFAEIGQRVGAGETAILDTLRRLQRRGAISRVGAVFVAGVSARFGVTARPDTLPRALMDAILGVLIELLPELP